MDKTLSFGMSYPESFPVTFMAQLVAPIRWKEIDAAATELTLGSSRNSI